MKTATLPKVALSETLDHLANLIERGVLDRAGLNEHIAALFEPLGFVWTQRQSFDLMEAALCRALLRSQNRDTFEGVQSLAANLPTQTVRSETQIAFQQFSTPAPLAYLAAMACCIGRDDHVLEPSAGTGLLAAMIPPCASLTLNELDGARADLLQPNFPHGCSTGGRNFRRSGAAPRCYQNRDERAQCECYARPNAISRRVIELAGIDLRRLRQAQAHPKDAD